MSPLMKREYRSIIEFLITVFALPTLLELEQTRIALI